MPQSNEQNSPHAFQERTDVRLTELEIKQSFNDDLLEQLNLIVFKQQAQIDALHAHIQRLQQMHNTQASDNSVRDPRAELPPHY